MSRSLASCGPISSIHSQSRGRVERGSISACTPKSSARGKTDCAAESSSSSSRRRASGSGAASISRRKASATPLSTGSAPISADGQASTVGAGPRWIPAATPNARRSTTAIQGTSLWSTANMAAIPWRMVAARSASGPIAKPGSSTRLTTGSRKASHSSTKRRIFCAASADMQPPRKWQSFATRPTGCPFSRASPVTSERPKSGPISKKEPRSTRCSITRRILYARLRSRGMIEISSSSSRSGGSPTSSTGAASQTLAGR